MARNLKAVEMRVCRNLWLGHPIRHTQSGYAQCGKNLHGKTIDNLRCDGFIHETATYGFDLTEQGREAVEEAEEAEEASRVKIKGSSSC